MRTMGHKIVAEAARRLAPTGGADSHRHDLFVADNQKIASDTQRMLVGWGSMTEMPAIEALENFVLGQFNGMVKMEHSSLRFYPDERCAALVVSWQSPTRRIEDAKKMARVSPDRYLEQGTKQIWEVRKAEDGTPFLVRKTDEDLDTLLSQRRQKAAASHQVSASFATLKSAGYLSVDEGDTVRFTHKGLTKVGRVERFDDSDNAYITSGEEKCKVAAPSIVEVVQKDPKTIQDYKAKSRAYFSKIFPSAYMAKWMRSGEAEETQDPQ